MARKLIMRLCQVDELNGGLEGSGYSPGDPNYVAAHAHINTDMFVYGLLDVAGGYHTSLNMKTIFNMDEEQQTDFDTLVGLINAPTLEQRLGRIFRFQSILAKWFAQSDFPIAAYDTPDDIQAQMMAIADGFQ